MWYTYYSFFVKFLDLIMIAQVIYWIFNQMRWQWKCTLVMQYLLTWPRAYMQYEMEEKHPLGKKVQLLWIFKKVLDIQVIPSKYFLAYYQKWVKVCPKKLPKEVLSKRFYTNCITYSKPVLYTWGCMHKHYCCDLNHMFLYTNSVL